MKQLAIWIFFCLFWHDVNAIESCDEISVNKTDGATLSQGKYTFKQAIIDDKSDLVIVPPTFPAGLKRVTFGRGDAVTTCYFKPLAIMQAGAGAKFWGWHLLWMESAGLFYARMDSEAWVSSPPKRITAFKPITPKIKLDGHTLNLTWQQVENGITVNMQAVSNDEGRSWDVNPKQP